MLLTLVGEVRADLAFSVYNDQACTQPATVVNWGDPLYPGNNYTQDIFIRNTGDIIFTQFSAGMSSVVPENATTYLSLACVSTGIMPLNPQDIGEVRLTLMVAPDAEPGAFSCTVIITGTGPDSDSGNSGGSGGGGYSRTIPMATKAPGASGTGNLNGFLFLVVVGVVAVLFLGKKH